MDTPTAIFRLKGALKEPKGIVVEANFSRLSLNYANVQLENTGPVKFRSSRESLEIEPVTLHGTDTNIKIEGSVQFSGAAQRRVARGWRGRPAAVQRFGAGHGCARQPRKSMPV